MRDRTTSCYCTYCQRRTLHVVRGGLLIPKRPRCSQCGTLNNPLKRP